MRPASSCCNRARCMSRRPSCPTKSGCKHPGLNGHPAGIGWGSGRAVVVNCECEIERVRPGDILVTKVAGPGAQPHSAARGRRRRRTRRFHLASGLAGARARHSHGARRARRHPPNSRRLAMRGRRRRRHRAVAAVSRKPRVFISQPIAPSALERLRKIAAVTVNTDSSKIIGKSKLIAAAKKCDILLSFLHDKSRPRGARRQSEIARALLAVDYARQYRRHGSHPARHSGDRGAADRGGSDGRHSFRIDDRGGAPHDRRRQDGARREISRLAIEPSRPAASCTARPSASSAARPHRQATARRALGFGMRILYWSPRRKPEAEREIGMECVHARGIAGAIRFRLVARAAQRRNPAYDLATSNSR